MTSLAGNAYEEGIGPGFDPIKALWKERNTKTEAAVRLDLTIDSTKQQYLYGIHNRRNISPDARIKMNVTAEK